METMGLWSFAASQAHCLLNEGLLGKHLRGEIS